MLALFACVATLSGCVFVLGIVYGADLMEKQNAKRCSPAIHIEVTT
jgi:hypothetical protein